ncbi:unnamed protein product [Prunus armeniaca]|uniref:Uncharacterized protein n=1 Tax=Prunus armeniaca TaxID=36596 RepID=A0A6J5TYU8_PRUAR|nr:unnamed protein product [Prunus armeniaca]
MDSQKEEGPAPLLWRFSDFLKWAELCPSEQEIGHSLLRLLDLLLQKYSALQMQMLALLRLSEVSNAVLTSLKHFNPMTLMRLLCHEQSIHRSSGSDHYDKDQNEDLLDSMRYYIEAAEVHKSIDAGNKTRRACARLPLCLFQIRMPDFQWLYRSETMPGGPC